MKTFNVGMIGYGYWGKILYRYFNTHPGFRFLHIATRNPKKLEGSFPDTLTFSSPEELIENKNINAVIVASPLGTHYEYVMKALECNKHVFAEKPMATKKTEGASISEKATEKGLKVFTDYLLTFSPTIRKMVSLANLGAIGKIRGCAFQVRQLGHFSNNVYWDLGCHILSIIDMLFPLNELNFRKNDILKRNGIVETGQITFNSRNNGGSSICGSILLSFNHPVKERNMTLYGDEGTLVYDMTKEKPLTLTRYEVDRARSRDPLKREVFEYEFDEFNTVREVVQGFYDTITGKIPANIKLAIKISEIIEGFINESSQSEAD